MKHLKGIVATIGFAMSISAHSVAADFDPVDIVEKFIVAFNERSADNMLALCSDDFRWYLVTHDETQMVTDGKAALAESLARDFSQPMSVQSSIMSSQVLGNTVSVVEKASWQGRSGEQQQCSIAVYEFDGGLISGIWYYPSQAC